MCSTRKRAPLKPRMVKLSNTPSLPRGGDERLVRTSTLVMTRTGKLTRNLRQTTLTGEDFTTRCHCSKVCKNIRGLKIHQSKSRCVTSATQVQRTDSWRDEGELQPGSIHHSTENLYAPQPPQHQWLDQAILSPVPPSIHWGKKGSNGQQQWKISFGHSLMMT